MVERNIAVHLDEDDEADYFQWIGGAVHFLAKDGRLCV